MAKKYYAVKKGRTTGVFDSWEACKTAVDGYPGALYQSFSSRADAEAFLAGGETKKQNKLETYLQAARQLRRV